MKVLFLDFDGVLNPYAPVASRSGQFSKAACSNLETLLNKIPDLKIVISSSWRAHGIMACKDILKSNGIDSRRVIGVTGHERCPDSNNHRGFQIQAWLDTMGQVHDVKEFAIVDDESDMGKLKNKLIQTDRRAGLTQTNVEKLMEMLKA